MSGDVNSLYCDDKVKIGMEQVESLLNETLSDTFLETQVNAMCQHVIKSGGKRMRPLMAVLSAHALPDFDHDQYMQQVAYIGAATEFLHTATLVHDDVIDKASLRRGVYTLNETSGNHAAVLAGDYLFTRCFELIHRLENFPIIRSINATIRQLVVGELHQLEHQGDIDMDLDTYYQTIYAKTGVLFEFAASAPAILTNSPLTSAFTTYGKELGIAFQIQDDILDYSADAQALGKDPGTDLKDQRITLPVLLALEYAKTQGDDVYKALVESIHKADLEAVQQAIHESKALDQCKELALQASDNAIAALNVLPNTIYREQLIALARKSVKRSS